jgi:hypothetical protein
MNRVELTKRFASETISLLRAGYWQQSLLGVAYFPEWLATVANERSPLIDQRPWITCTAIAFLQKKLKGNGSIFEWGSGGSTAFYAKHAKHVITIEHDPEWYEQVNQSLEHSARQRVDMRLVPPTASHDNRSGDPGNPDDYCSADAGFINQSFYDYVTAVDQYPSDAFELISIDGRSRPACLKHAVQHVAKGGYLLLDNSDREYYHSKTPPELSFWRKFEFVGPVNYSGMFGRTLIWQRTK